MGTALSERQRRLRDEFIDARGYWDETWEGLLELDADFFEACLAMYAAPSRTGSLEPKVRELVSIAVNAAATHLYQPGIRRHVRRALELGVSKEEIMEVLELTSTLGIHACNIGVPILVEELRAKGTELERTLSARQEQLKADFTRKRGYWNPFWDDLLALDPDFFETYTAFSSVPWVKGTLEPKVKEFIYTAFDVAATHLYSPGLRQHIRNALDYGATAQELMEVIELATVIGIHAVAVGVPILLEETATTRA
jgi:alkylhydroperoxidase/carboxymuconolactone decarboxylase family protein YurZ